MPHVYSVYENHLSVSVSVNRGNSLQEWCAGILRSGRFPGREGPGKSPRPGMGEEEAEEWGLRHPSHLHTKQLYFSMSYKWGFADTFHVGKGFFVKKKKTHKTQS